MNGRMQYIFSGNKKVSRINSNLFFFFNFFTTGRINSLNGFYFIAKEINTVSKIGIGQKNIYGIAFYPESSRA